MAYTGCTQSGDNICVMKPKFTNRGRRRRQRPGVFFLSALAIAIIVFVVVELIQWAVAPGAGRSAGQKAAASVTALMPQPSQDSLATFELFMRRGGCETGCPYYALSVKQNSLEYVGVRGVKKHGEVKEPLTAQRKRKLLELVRKASFFALADSYRPTDKGCGLKHVGAPTFTVGVTLNGQTKIVKANEGCSNVPPRLLALARGIDRVSGSGQWTGTADAPASSTAH